MKSLHLRVHSETISLENPIFLTIQIEQHEEYIQCMQFLYGGFVSLKNDYFSITNSENLKESLDEEALFLPNPFEIDLNSKRNVNALIKILKKAYYDKAMTSIDEIEDSIQKAIDSIKLDFDAEITYTLDLKPDDLFKLANIKFKEDYETVLERVCKWAIISNELAKASIIFTCHLRDYFSDEEIEQLVKELTYRNISLVNIETFNQKTSIQNEKIIIIDNDFCVIK